MSCLINNFPLALNIFVCCMWVNQVQVNILEEGNEGNLHHSSETYTWHLRVNFFVCSTSLMILTHFGRGTAAENSKEQNQNQGRAGENCTWWVLCCYIIVATNQTVTVSHFYTGFISMVTPAYELAIINATTWTVTPCLGSNIKPLKKTSIMPLPLLFLHQCMPSNRQLMVTLFSWLSSDCWILVRLCAHNRTVSTEGLCQILSLLQAKWKWKRSEAKKNTCKNKCQSSSKNTW